MAKVIPFDPQYTQQFRDLNLQWIKQFFVVETMDMYQLEHPESTIIEKGGQVISLPLPSLPLHFFLLILQWNQTILV
jgi:hypothetical protein